MTINKTEMSQQSKNFEHDKLAKLSLQENEIHLWAVQPQTFSCKESFKESCKESDEKTFEGSSEKCNKSLLSQYKELLTADETKKQQRYKFEKDRHDALITRAFVRDLLSQYTDIQPEDWRYRRGTEALGQWRRRRAVL